MRRIFSTLRRPHEPAFTVESLAMSATIRPPIVPVPVTTPSAGSSGSRLLASAASSTKLPGVEQARDALAGEELALLGVLLVVLGGPSSFDAGQRVLQLLIERHGAWGLVAALSAKPVTDGRRAAR